MASGLFDTVVQEEPFKSDPERGHNWGYRPYPAEVCPQVLIDAKIKTAKYSDKAIRMFGSRGLYLEISTAGGKLWRVKCKFDGKEKRLALGTYPNTPLIEAGEKREQARHLLADGIDPNENRKVQKAARIQRSENSFEVVAREWLTKHRPYWAASHADGIIKRL